MKIIVGSRGSKLAITQTNWVIDKIKEHNKDLDIELKIIKTKGDRIQDVALDKIGDKGVFVKEIEEELLNHKIDIAVHSMKDMPGELPKGLKFSYTPKREDFHDVLVLKKEYKSIDDLPTGAKIGTGSKRRKFQLLNYRDDLNIVSIRGNIDTRIRKIKDENLDGVVLANAGINRLKINSEIEYNILSLSEDIILPAPTQGILAIEVRENDNNIDNILKPINDYKTEIQAKAERAFLKAIDGSCKLPVGALCKVNDDNIVLDGLFGFEDGSLIIRKSLSGKKEDAETIGNKLANDIKKEMI